ncbi:aminotransferase class V-fold PLP-dependent enzyme [Actinomadura sp. LD22]|uniref:cysteine desulfurase n=1 Tax=Actinomadura physcomitrii TaxID=2650748 RepID=A0A6I4MFG8_9ACTN|nr:cysteine desulfurase family protein [Actinomadura physcomitrii]MWA02727.1 aminotransferase class V-fold PLP-dependent enzyme [Actinomadura physcomitrii]
MTEPQRCEPVYLDYNATAPLRSEAHEAIMEAFQHAGNASSLHHAGQDAAARVDRGRRQVASLLNCAPGELIFTSGATEANNLALRACHTPDTVLVISAVEHPAVLETARSLTADRPDLLVELPVDADGIVDLDPLRFVCARRQLSVVSVMSANNETGVLTDLKPIIKLAHEAGALVHTDATQQVGRVPLDLAELEVDLLSLSAHKFGGPQGVGALFIRRGASLPYRPLLTGGGQERGWRAGTLNVPGIAGTGAAAQAAQHHLAEEVQRVGALRMLLESELKLRVPGCRINGARAQRLPGVTSVTFPGTPADAVLAAMPEVAASQGSACASGAPTPSHVLLAMGLSRDDADATVRYSFGFATTKHDIGHAVDATVRAVEHVRAALAAGAEP